MNTILNQMPWWFVDFQLSATVLLGMVVVGLWATRQPAHRVALGWAAALALMALFVAAALPVWPKWHSVHPIAMTAPAPAQNRDTGTVFREPAPARTEAEFISAPARASSPSAATVPKPATPTSIVLWMARAFPLGTAAAGLWLLLGMVEAIWLVGTARPAPPELLKQLHAVAGERAPSIRLLLSNHVHNAVALGIWRPAIILPAALAQRSGEKSLRAVLAHEAAHIANRDLWLLGLMRGLMVVLFPHPLYWMIRRSIRNSQEALADAVAAQSRETDYAEGLVEWVRHMAKPRQILAANAAGIWEGPLDLSRRISLLLDENLTVQTRLPRRWRVGVAVCAGTVALSLSLFTVRPVSAGGFQHAERLATSSLTPGSGAPTPAGSDTAISLKGVSEYRSFETNGAFEYQADGLMTYSGCGEGMPKFRNTFEVLVSNSDWAIKLKPLDIPQAALFAVVHTGSSIYYYTFYSEPTASQAWNDGIAVAVKGEVPIEKGNFANYLWLGLASSSYLKSSDPKAIRPIWLYRDGDPTTVKTEMELFDAPPFLPRRLVYYENPRPTYPPPLKDGWKAGELRVLSETNVGSLKFPTSLLYEAFHPKADAISQNDLQKQYEVAIIVSNIWTTNPSGITLPNLAGHTLFEEKRFNSLPAGFAGVVYEYTNQQLPASPDRLARQRYAVLRGAMGATNSGDIENLPSPATREKSDAPDLKTGTMAPDFVSKGVSGNSVRLSDWKGKIILLDFWATWCGPCRASLPHTESVAKRCKDQGVVVLANCTGDTRAHFASFVQTNQSTNPDIVFVCDLHDRGTGDYDERASHKLYGCKVIPTQFIIGRDGKIAAVIVGYREGDHQLEDALAKLGVSLP